MDKKNSSNIIQVATFAALGREYAVEIQYVTEIIYYREVTPIPQSPDFIEGVIELRRYVLPVINLASKLNANSGKILGSEHILILRFAGKRIGIIVDKVQTIVRISQNVIQLKQDDESGFLKGVFKHDNQLIMLLNVEQLLSKSEAVMLRKAV